MSEGYYGQVAAAFNRAASSYQADYAANPIIAWLQDDTFAHLTGLFPEGSHLLEIGCGTGDMALRLAEAGRTVVATDIAPAMIAAGQALAADRPLRGQLTWLVCAAGEVGQAVRGPFDGAYSNFGALNCEPDLPRVAGALAGLLGPGAPFLCSVMNRWCAWELAWGLAHLRPSEATRRVKRGWVLARMSAGPGEAPSAIPVRYFTPGEFVRAFRPHFRLEAAFGYPVLIPPPYLADHFHDAPARLGGVERRVRGWPVLRSLGDHFLLIMRRTP